MTARELTIRYNQLADRADRLREMILERFRRVAREAGIEPSPTLVENALLSYADGRPWRGVDYSKIRLAKRLYQRSFVPHRIVGRWWTQKVRQLQAWAKVS